MRTLKIWAPMTLLLFLAGSAWAGELIQIAQHGNPNVSLQINAYGGATHGTKLKVVFGCPPGSPDCTWTLLPNGMIVSDTNPTLAWNAYGGDKHGADITLVNNCTPDLNGCTWTVRSDGLIVSKRNPQFAVNAFGGTSPGNPLKLVNNCAPELDGCKWVTPWSGGANLGPSRMLYSAETNNAFAVNAYGGAKDRTELQIVNNCRDDIWDCTWRLQSDGMIISDSSANLAWNAYGGAQVGTKVTLVVGCPADNSDCQWDLRPDGLIVSRTKPNLAVKAQGGPRHNAPLVLVDDCTPAMAGCKWSTTPQSATADPGRPSPIFNSHLNDPGKPLRGFVDLHTHPMAHLGFGGHVVFGAPDVGITMLPDGIYNKDNVGLFRGPTCNTEQRPAQNIEEALGDSYSAHGGWDAERNKCGNEIRKFILSMSEHKYESNIISIDHPKGYPSFTHWPAHNDVLHQQMWVDWIKRAKEGGLRVMVALAVNNFTLASVLQPNSKTPIDDKTVGDMQINELKKFVGNHQDFMQIAYSPQDLRRIVESDRLAVIIGVELDDLANMLRDNVSPTEDMARGEIRRLYSLGVRYAFPVHLIDNHFGGTAVYEPEFVLANRFQTGQWLKLTCSSQGEGITKRIAPDEKQLAMLNVLKLGAGNQPLPNCAAGVGFKNEVGLKPLGHVVLDEMMALGMLIDIDHMSQQTANETLNYTADRTGKLPADQYPIVSGHNALRVPYSAHRVSNNDHDSENQRTTDQYHKIAARGGIAGVGFGGSNAPDFLRDANAVAALGIPVNLGSDINGLIDMPYSFECQSTPCIQYSATFPQARMGEKVWDYNRDGVAHIGLFPDFLKHVENLFGGPPLVDKLYNGADAFAKMWEKAGQVSQKIQSSSPPPSTTQGGSSSGTGSRVGPDDQSLSGEQRRR